MVNFKVLTLLVVVMAAVSVSQAAVFGQGNIMHRRYPNGPSVFHTMKPSVWRGAPNSRTPVAGTNQNFGPVVNTRFGGAPVAAVPRRDYSWMQKGGAKRVHGKYWTY